MFYTTESGHEQVQMDNSYHNIKLTKLAKILFQIENSVLRSYVAIGCGSNFASNLNHRGLEAPKFRFAFSVKHVLLVMLCIMMLLQNQQFGRLNTRIRLHSWSSKCHAIQVSYLIIISILVELFSTVLVVHG